MRSSKILDEASGDLRKRSDDRFRPSLSVFIHYDNTVRTIGWMALNYYYHIDLKNGQDFTHFIPKSKFEKIKYQSPESNRFNRDIERPVA